jgi:cytochrome c oxidase subunit II
MMPARIQSALDAAGIQAARIEWLWWLMFWVTTAVFVLVVAAVVLAVRRGRSTDPARPDNRALQRAVGSAVGLTIVILFGLLYASAATGRAIGTPPGDKPLVIQITGQQWWWSVEYVNDAPSQRFTTANELHIPIGRPVVLNLRSPDVIHSFWVPNLHGKMDLIPGRLNTTWFRADVPGVYRGQCAEYCGMQHAHMGLVVVAEQPDAYQRWEDAQRQNAPDPSSPQQARGRGIVERGPCALCHTVRGTQAGARTGPDLTHFASRSTIGAATAPNTPGYLAGWIANPQHLKPGNRMPATGLSAEDLQAVLAYLETLR